MPVKPRAKPDVLRTGTAALRQETGAAKDDAVDAAEEEVSVSLAAPPAAPEPAVAARKGVGKAVLPRALGGCAA